MGAPRNVSRSVEGHELLLDADGRRVLFAVQVGERVVEPVKGWHRWRLPRGSGPLVIEASTEATVDAHLCIDVTVRVEGAR